jgi:hypothetical protein
MPMLDEDEYARVSRLYSESVKATKRFRERTGVSLKDPSIDELYRPVRDEYERLTGIKESNHNAIMHHRLSLYGPPCKQCQRPLRTPKAKLCGSCMFPVKDT